MTLYDAAAPQNTRTPLCVVCAKPIQIFAVRKCGHYTCFVCSLRLSLLVGKSGCALCRSNTSKIYLVVSPPLDVELDTIAFDQIDTTSFCYDKDGDFYYQNDYILNAVDLLRRPFCPLPQCWEGGYQDPFIHVKGLQSHLKNDHKLQYCDICLRSRPAFLSEQKTYPIHMIDKHHKGECSVDDETFRGHVQCLFCKTYLYDNDAFSVHMRDMHFLCEICTKGGTLHRYLNNFSALTAHFEKQHYLCCHPECLETKDPRERVFLSEMELFLHLKKEHDVKGSKKMQFNPTSLGFRYQENGNTNAQRSTGQSDSADGNLTHSEKTNIVTFDFGKYTKQVNLVRSRAMVKAIQESGGIVPQDPGRPQRSLRDVPGGKAAVTPASPACAPHPKSGATRALAACVSLDPQTTTVGGGSGNERVDDPWDACFTSLLGHKAAQELRVHVTKYNRSDMKCASFFSACVALCGDLLDDLIPTLSELVSDPLKKDAFQTAYSSYISKDRGCEDAMQSSATGKGSRRTISKKERKSMNQFTGDAGEDSSKDFPALSRNSPAFLRKDWAARAASLIDTRSFTGVRVTHVNEAESITGGAVRSVVDLDTYQEEFPELQAIQKRGTRSKKNKAVSSSTTGRNPPVENAWRKGNLVDKLKK